MDRLLSSRLLLFSSHIFRTPSRSLPSTIQHSSSTRCFSSTPAQYKGERIKPDKRISLLRYFLHKHPRSPRPLRWSRQRTLRHWTIHRAWHLYQSSLRTARQVELEKQWRCMRDACEELRLIGSDGCRVEEGGQGKDLGLLFRSNYARERRATVPIEYARMMTDYPAREGWNSGWRAGR